MINIGICNGRRTWEVTINNQKTDVYDIYELCRALTKELPA
jgi:hypothetical protein